MAAEEPANSQNQQEQDKAVDKQHLRQIYEAIQAYRKDHGDLPNWMSDLVPQYLKDASVLISPVETRTGQSQLFGYEDPKIHSSYIYEFSAASSGRRDGQTPLTMKQWKTKQMQNFGPVSPILRCHLHSPVLNIAFSGDYYETELLWESDPNTLALMEKLGPGPGVKDQKHLRVQVIDNLNGAPVPGAILRIADIDTAQGAVPPRKAMTDAQGNGQLPLGNLDLRKFTLSVSKPGFANYQMTWNGGSVPDERTVKLDHAITIGGTVQDQEGNPIAKATVTVNGIVRDAAGQSIEVPYDSATTDPAGKWSSAAVPADFQWLTLKLSHAEFLPAEFDLAPDGQPSTGNLTRSNLLDKTSVLRMHAGVRVEGTVTDRQGQPIAGAEVALARDSDPPKRQSRRTDKSGIFRFVILEVCDCFLVIQAKDYAPQWQAVRVEPGLRPFKIVLAPGKVLKGRVIDAADKPVEGATIAAESWNARPLLNWRTRTDFEGRFTWQSAPEDAVLYTISKDGYNTVSGHELVAKDGEFEIRLQQAFRLSGKVVDAETQQPISQFTLIKGRTYGGSDDPPNWERYNAIRGSGGWYSYQEQGEPSANLRFLVEAPGYLPMVSPEIAMSGWHTNDFELKKGNGPAGVVQTADGSPVQAAEVALIGVGDFRLAKAKFDSRDSTTEKFIVKTDIQGQFALPPALSTLIVAVHEKGYGEISPDDLVKSGKLVLQPWGTIEGTLMVGNKPGTNLQVMVTPQSVGRSPLIYNWNYFQTRTDGEGRFLFTYVPPGAQTLVRLIPWGQRNMAHSHTMPIEVKPGDVTRVTYGGTGRSITGKATVSNPATKVDWQRDHQFLGTKVPQPPQNLKTPEELRAWNSSDAVRKAQRDYRNYSVHFETDNSFRIDDIPAGTYVLHLCLTDPEDAASRIGMGRRIGTLAKEIVVPEMPNGRSEEPLDVGTLTIQIKKQLNIGDPTPLFELKTIEDQPLKLANYRGKYVLLNFWTGPLAAAEESLTQLKSVYDAFGKDDRFVMMGVNVGQGSAEVREFIRANQMPWVQGLAGEWTNNQTLAAYGVEAPPASFLIDPDGKLIALGLQGPEIRAAVERALRGPRGM